MSKEIKFEEKVVFFVSIFLFIILMAHKFIFVW
jgi:hypothetical protein